jgi:hypothetical protein
VRLDEGFHRTLHPEWNKRWSKFFEDNPGATETEMFEFAADFDG